MRTSEYCVFIQSIMFLLTALFGFILISITEATTNQIGKTVRISNVQPRRDTNGDILNAHDGAMYVVDGRYYLVGTAYEKCQGFTNCSSNIGDCGWQDNNFSLYSSTDLETWKLENGNLLPNRQHGGANFRPKLIYNDDNKEWVLWFNFQTPKPNIPGYYTVATSESIAGPYKIYQEQVNVSRALKGDFNLFKDDDGTAYIIYNSDINGHLCVACHIPPCDCGFQMSVEMLSPDYKSSTMENSGWIGAPTVEAPIMFKRQGIYYLLFDRLSCFGPQGSGSVVYTGSTPLGKYTAQNNINRYGPFRESQLSFIIVSAQQAYVTQIGELFIWIGDMWDSYVEPGTGRNVKAYDYQVWLPLQFDNTGNISKLVWQDEWLATLP
eukprot:m.34323 g.34323  ORF g.34323 m.34323 type:complete len:380 (+) comp8707_c0_seq2:61-1200(+)